MAPNSSYYIIFPFGKHKNKSLGHVFDTDPGYIEWLATMHNMPGSWSLACQRLLINESIDDLNLPKQKVIEDSTVQITMTASNKKTVYVQFGYNKALLERFKYEIDGRKWVPSESCWEVPSAQLPKMIQLFGGTKNVTADDTVKQWYKEEISRREELDVIRVKHDGDYDVKNLKMELYPYQKTAVEFFMRANGRILIADAPGVGKTGESIACAMHVHAKTLIICPKSVVIGWYREIERFTGKKATIWNSDGKVGRVDAQFHLIHYDIVQKHVDELKKLKCDLLVCDEATYIKNRTTKRAKAILGDPKKKRGGNGLKTTYVIFLTGTPVLNRPVEAFTLLHFISPDRFNNFFHFVQKYGGWRGSPSRNLDDLHHRTKDIVIRRLKSDVLTDLPEIQRNDLFVELSTSEYKEYKKLLNELFSKWKTSNKPTLAEMPKIQGYLIEKKLPRLIEMIDEYIEQDRGILVYSCYIAPLEKLKAHYKDQAAIIHGQLSTAQRQESIDALKHKQAKIGLFSIGAGAMGIDGLQYSMDTVVFLDSAWVPALHDQGEGRLFRNGQTNQVQSYYMSVVNTIDEYMREMLLGKQEIVDKIVDGQILNLDRNKNYFKDFVNKLKSDYSSELQDTEFTEIIDA